MKVGIIGITGITLEFACRAAKLGYEVLVSSTGSSVLLKETVQRISGNIKTVTVSEAACAEILILFIPREQLESSLKKLPDMVGKIVLHTNNPIFYYEASAPVMIEGSSCRIIKALLPGIHLIKIFNSLIDKHSSAAQKCHKSKTEIFYSGDDVRAKNIVKFFLDNLNFAGIEINKKCSI
ncbi:NADPH-dependent F420 reductase [Flavobacterium sp.]|uniref:NADPH-dependent F420 reductase n=1 Tax=Flavobacterium sp. TaxID=239 RepID=UPI002ED9D419